MMVVCADGVRVPLQTLQSRGLARILFIVSRPLLRQDGRGV